MKQVWGMCGHIKHQGEGFTTNWILSAFKIRLNDMFKQNWRGNKWSNSMCKSYRIYKDELVFEKYLIALSNKDIITY